MFTNPPLLCCSVLCCAQVEIRACTSRESPIIVDCNNVFSQFFVEGNMTWRGTIKFINSYPSMRRAGLWELISPFHIDKAGQLHFQVSTAPGSGSALALSAQWCWLLSPQSYACPVARSLLAWLPASTVQPVDNCPGPVVCLP
jgi:hypothetical protein